MKLLLALSLLHLFAAQGEIPGPNAFVDLDSPNDCKLAVDSASMEGRKVCLWDPKGKNTVICGADDNNPPCSGQCSNANVNLARYAMCPGSTICGQDLVFMDQI